MSTNPQDAELTWAVGIDLRFTTTHEGGRTSNLLGGSSPAHRLEYRPNWGFPGWEAEAQTAGPIWGFSREGIAPGDQVRAVVFALSPDMTPDWAFLRPGDHLRMYEGSRVCGRAVVTWLDRVTRSPSEASIERFDRWLSDAAISD